RRHTRSKRDWSSDVCSSDLAARYILASPAPAFLTETLPGAEEGDYDEEAMSILKTSREAVRNLLADTRRPIGQTLALVLLYGCRSEERRVGKECRHLVRGEQ